MGLDKLFGLLGIGLTEGGVLEPVFYGMPPCLGRQDLLCCACRHGCLTGGGKIIGGKAK